jgi:hypothetical protein
MIGGRYSKNMVNHFYLVYYNFIKWMESTKLLNNERRFSVAEFYMYIIFFEWLIFVYVGLTQFSLVSIDFLEKNKWTTIGIGITIVLCIQLLINSLLKNKISDLKNKYSQIYNWKTSSYRKRAILYTIFYFILFPFFLIGFYIFLDILV